MHEAEPHFKLGRHNPGGGMVEHRHPHVFSRQNGSRGLGLTIAAADGHIELLGRLTELTPGPYNLVYELIDPFEGFLPGRYTWPSPLDLAELLAILADYGEFLGGDARHNLEIDAADGSRLTYDQHNFIYARGDIERMEATLLDAGFGPGESVLPSPHSHHVRSEYSARARELLNLTTWSYSSFPEED